jgi:ribosome-binding protein aMBF1 (putative translation factor)
MFDSQIRTRLDGETSTRPANVILPKAEYLQLQRSAGAHPDAVDAMAYASGSLAQTLTAARQQAGLTQAELAKRLGKSEPLISGTENGSVSISERYVSAVLKACGLPSDWKGPARQKKRAAKK